MVLSPFLIIHFLLSKQCYFSKCRSQTPHLNDFSLHEQYSSQQGYFSNFIINKLVSLPQKAKNRAIEVKITKNRAI